MGESVVRIYLRPGQTVEFVSSGLIEVDWNKKTGEIERWSVTGVKEITLSAIPPQSIAAIVAVPIRTADLDYWNPIWDDDMLTEYNT